MNVKIGDTVRLKKEWYKEDVCKKICRTIKMDYKTYKNDFVIKRIEPNFLDWGECVSLTSDLNIGYVIPTSLLELVESDSKFAVIRLCENCLYKRLAIRSEPCCSCFAHSNWVSQSTPVAIKRKWTKAEINEANRIIGELFSNANDGEIYVLDDSEYGANHEIKLMDRNGHFFYSHPSKADEPNKSIGICVALCKAFRKPIPKFIMGE